MARKPLPWPLATRWPLPSDNPVQWGSNPPGFTPPSVLEFNREFIRQFQASSQFLRKVKEAYQAA